MFNLREALSWSEAVAAYEAGQRQFTSFLRYPAHPFPGERTCKDCIKGCQLASIDHTNPLSLTARCLCGARLKCGLFEIGVRDKKPKKDRQFDDFTRSAIFKRDLCRCFMCGQGPEQEVEIEADHIVPHCMGGPTTLENGITLCRGCNQAKSGRFDTWFVTRALIHTHMTLEERANGQHADVYAVLRRVANFYIAWRKKVDAAG